MSEKVLALGGVVLIAVAGFGCAVYYSRKHGGDNGLMLKMMGLVILTALAAFAWGNYSDTLDDLDKEAREIKEKDAIVVSVMPAGIVQGGMQTTDNALFFSSSYTSFETDKGVYRVRGSHIVQKGLNAEIQLRGTGREYFCVGGAGNCMRLSSN